MSKHHLREQRNCLNCGNTVDQRFCSNCGQENIEPRQTFGHLVAHFFEDLTHYEGKFWETLRYLFFRPAFLSKEFIAGKRSKYLPPVRLYIFASFITFLLTAIIPDAPSSDHNDGEEHPASEIIMDSIAANRRRDSLMEAAIISRIPGKDSIDSIVNRSTSRPSTSIGVSDLLSFDDMDGVSYKGIKNKHELDSTKQARSTTDDPMWLLDYKIAKKVIELHRYPPKIQLELFGKALKSNFPKTLFLYMPLFALLLRLFHKRKNWIYFDHGIFTLHYFSFLLLSFLLMMVSLEAMNWVEYLFPSLDWLNYLVGGLLIGGLTFFYPYYLFRAHRKMYGESQGISMLKTWAILTLNFFLLMVLFVVLVVATILMMH
jgi:hypothetical protein